MLSNIFEQIIMNLVLIFKSIIDLTFKYNMNESYYSTKLLKRNV